MDLLWGVGFSRAGVGCITILCLDAFPAYMDALVSGLSNCTGRCACLWPTSAQSSCFPEGKDLSFLLLSYPRLQVGWGGLSLSWEC